MSRRHSSGFKHSRFILTEGPEDAALLRELIQFHNLGDFDVSPNEDVGSVAGNSGFGKAIVGCEPLTGFNAVEDVVIFGDNDDAPVDSFANICGQIENARELGNIGRNWGVAIQPAIKAPGDPSVSIWLWPRAAQQGCLETVLWSAIQTAHPAEAACAQAAVNCSNASAWPISKRDKSLVRCFLSITCRANPGISLGNLWRDADDLIPLSDPAFEPICEFLRAI